MIVYEKIQSVIMYYNYGVSPEHQNMFDAYFNSLI